MRMLNLKVQDLETQLKICFSKQGQLTNKMGNMVNTCEQTKFKQEENERNLKEIYQEWVNRE